MQLQSLKLLHLKEEIHLQENTFFDLWPWPWGAKVTQYIAQYPLHHVTYSGITFEVVMSNGLGGYRYIYKKCGGWIHAHADWQMDGQSHIFYFSNF